MVFIPYIRGATAHEAQICRIWVRIPFWRFLRVGVLPFIRIVNTDQEGGS